MSHLLRIVILVFTLHRVIFAADLLHLTSVYSRGNDDFDESNHETAKITLELIVSELAPSSLQTNLYYTAVFSIEHPHNSASGEYWLKQRFNEVEPNLTASQFTYTPGPSNGSLGGKASGKIFLGQVDKSKSRPFQGRIAVTALPDFDPNSPMGVDSLIDWGFLLKDGVPQLGNLSLTPQWKGITRPSEEMLRLISSNFIDSTSFRKPFSPKDF